MDRERKEKKKKKTSNALPLWLSGKESACNAGDIRGPPAPLAQEAVVCVLPAMLQSRERHPQWWDKIGRAHV